MGENINQKKQIVGSQAGDRSKEAVKMMALHDALRSICLNSDWTYSVFWTIRPRPRIRGGYGCKIGDENGSLMLMWEDGFCIGTSSNQMSTKNPVKKAFSKMSIQLYNYGEGLMGKVASDKCHKWIFKRPNEFEPLNMSKYWQSSFDSIPPEWNEQFDSGIQTIAVIQVGHGLLQLGSCKVITEDLHFVLKMRQIFESLCYQSCFYLYQSSSVRPIPVPSMAQMIQNSSKEESQMFILPNSSSEEQDMIKCPSRLSIFDAITGIEDETKLMFNPVCEPAHRNEILNFDSKFKRTSSNSNVLQFDALSAGDYNHEQGFYSDSMGTFVD